jgi:hypothetical protein
MHFWNIIGTTILDVKTVSSKLSYQTCVYNYVSRKPLVWKYFFCIVKQLSGMGNNFHEKELHCIGTSNFFCCESGSLPLRYLGFISIAENFERWYPIESHFGRNLWCWIGAFIWRSTCSYLLCHDQFMLSFLEIPKGILKFLIPTKQW